MVNNEELDLILSNSYKWIKVPQFKFVGVDSDVVLEEFNKHHIAETTFLINKVKELAQQIKDLTPETKETSLPGMEDIQVIKSHPQAIK